MAKKPLEIDITELLFPLGDLTAEDKRKQEIWTKASKDAYELVGASSPMFLMSKTNEFYRNYLHAEKLPYDEERGF